MLFSILIFYVFVYFPFVTQTTWSVLDNSMECSVLQKRMLTNRMKRNNTLSR